MSASARMPASVGFLVVLIWLSALLSLVEGALLMFAQESTLLAFGVDQGMATKTGVVAIAVGVVMALLASALGNGSRVARFVITAVLVFRFSVSAFVLTQLWGAHGAWVAGLNGAIALCMLSLLWNARASAFFASR